MSDYQRQASNVQSQVQNLIRQCNYKQTKIKVGADIQKFILNNQNCAMSVVQYKEEGQASESSLIQIRGKLLVKLLNGEKLFGFKFIIPTFYPYMPPIAFLDEPENPMLIEFIDYITYSNRIDFQYLVDWKKNFQQSESKFNLQQLLIHINKLFTEIPPIPFDQLSFNQNNLQLQKQSSIEEQIRMVDEQYESDQFQRQMSLYDKQEAFRQSTMISKKNIENQQKIAIVSQLASKTKKYLEEYEMMKRSEIEIHIQSLQKFNNKYDQINSELLNINEKNKQLQQATQEMDELINQYQGSLEQQEDQEMTNEIIQNQIYPPHNEVCKKVIYYESKIAAIEDCILMLKSYSDVLEIQEELKQVRKLSSQQFKVMFKRNKLVAYLNVKK